MQNETQNHNIKVELVQPEPKKQENKCDGIWGKSLKVIGVLAVAGAVGFAGYKAYEHYVEDAGVDVEEV